MSYCEIAPGHPFHGPYHDTEYGFPVRDDAVLFERLALETGSMSARSPATGIPRRRGSSPMPG